MKKASNSCKLFLLNTIYSLKFIFIHSETYRGKYTAAISFYELKTSVTRFPFWKHMTLIIQYRWWNLFNKYPYCGRFIVITVLDAAFGKTRARPGQRGIKYFYYFTMNQPGNNQDYRILLNYLPIRKNTLLQRFRVKMFNFYLTRFDYIIVLDNNTTITRCSCWINLQDGILRNNLRLFIIASYLRMSFFKCIVMPTY